ncbi:MAG: hypothetical protein KDF25_10050 [Burkholderiaceae bacterium]|nr:hypothetical protein [Burkholderiaceae bacterium]
MKPFVLDSSHTSVAGVFYPKGHVFALFPKPQLARQAAEQLAAAGYLGECAFADSETIMKDVVRTVGSGDVPLPSVGAESDIVRRIADLAGSGHCALLIDVTKHDEPDMLASTLHAEGAVAAFYYRTLVIEDLIEQPQTGGKQSVTVGTHAAAPQPDQG